MMNHKKPVEQELRAQKEMELNDMEQELSDEQKDRVQGGINGKGSRILRRMG